MKQFIQPLPTIEELSLVEKDNFLLFVKSDTKNNEQELFRFDLRGNAPNVEYWVLFEVNDNKKTYETLLGWAARQLEYVSNKDQVSTLSKNSPTLVNKERNLKKLIERITIYTPAISLMIIWDNSYSLRAFPKAKELVEKALQQKLKRDINETIEILLASQDIEKVIRGLDYAIHMHLDPNSKVRSPKTYPLHLAVKFGLYEHAEALLRAGARVDFADGSGLLPIHLASKNKDKNFTNLLVEYGASFKSLTEDRDNCLHMVLKGDLTQENYPQDSKFIDYLLAKGVNIDGQNKAKDTPLHLAMLGEWQGYASKLIDLGASCSLKNSKGKDPYDLLCQREKRLEGEVLESKGAKMNPNAPAFVPSYMLRGSEQALSLVVIGPTAQRVKTFSLLGKY